MEGQSISEIPPEEGAVKHLLETEVEEIDPYDPRLCALTWTSIEMLDKMKSTGMLQDRSEYTDASTEEIIGIALPGLLHAVESLPQGNAVSHLLANPDEAKEAAEFAAAQVAQIHYFLDQLGLPFDDQVLSEAVSSYLSDGDLQAQDAIDKLIMPEKVTVAWEIDSSAELFSLLTPEARERVPSVAQEARKRKGIVIGISTPSITTDFRVMGIDSPEGENMRFSFGQKGMKYPNIGVNKPMGEVEKAYYVSLRGGNNPTDS